MANTETEYKWTVKNPVEFDRFLSVLRALCSIEKTQILRITDRYLDTAEGRLSSQKVALRIRCCNGKYEATYKTRTQLVDGVARREEYIQKLKGEKNFITVLKQLQKSSIWPHLILPNLQVRFTLSNYRRTYLVRFGGAVCEVALDSYIVYAAAKRQHRREIELELKSGPESMLNALAEELEKQAGLVRAEISKVAGAERLLKL